MKTSIVTLLVVTHLRGGVCATDLNALVARLERHEQLLRAIEVEADIVARPAPREAHQRIEEALRRLGRLEHRSRYISKDDGANEESVRLRWWQEGGKARSEAQSEVTPEETSTVTFDGVLVRELATIKEQRVGSIKTAEGAHWGRAHDRDSLDFFLGYHATPFSQLLRTGRGVSIDTEGTSAGDVVVKLQHPEADNFWLDLIFNAHGAVREVQVTAQIEEAEPRLYEWWSYDEYRTYVDPSGEQIQYPGLIVQHLCLGSFEDLGRVEYASTEYRIRSIEVKADIPDEMFTLRFPDGVPVYDGVNGYGWTEDPRKTASIVEFDPDQPQDWPVWRMVGLGLAFFSVAGTLLLWQRRRRRDRGPLARGQGMKRQ